MYTYVGHKRHVDAQPSTGPSLSGPAKRRDSGQNGVDKGKRGAAGANEPAGAGAFGVLLAAFLCTLARCSPAAGASRACGQACGIDCAFLVAPPSPPPGSQVQHRPCEPSAPRRWSTQFHAPSSAPTTARRCPFRRTQIHLPRHAPRVPCSAQLTFRPTLASIHHPPLRARPPSARRHCCCCCRCCCACCAVLRCAALCCAVSKPACPAAAPYSHHQPAASLASTPTPLSPTALLSNGHPLPVSQPFPFQPHHLHYYQLATPLLFPSNLPTAWP